MINVFLFAPGKTFTSYFYERNSPFTWISMRNLTSTEYPLFSAEAWHYRIIDFSLLSKRRTLATIEYLRTMAAAQLRPFSRQLHNFPVILDGVVLPFFFYVVIVTFVYFILQSWGSLTVRLRLNC